MPVASLVLLMALAVAAPAKKPAAEAKAAKPAGKSPEWISASGLEAGAERASLQGAMLRAGLLAKERSFAAASRAYGNLVRRWPGAPVAERALLEAAGTALAAGQHARAVKLVRELGARWPGGTTAELRDRTELAIAEARLTASRNRSLSAKRAKREAGVAYREFTAILKRERVGPLAERAALGRARALYRLGRIGRAVKALANFLKSTPRSPLAPTVCNDLAVIRSNRARGRSLERGELERIMEELDWELEAGRRAATKKPADEAIRETYKAIAARRAELKIDEARLYIRLKKPRAAETVLRSVLRRYGDTPSAGRAARLLEELSEK